MPKQYIEFVAGCFAFNRAPFGSHSADQERAFEYLTWLRQKGIGWKEARQEIRNYLVSKRVPKKFMKEQLIIASKMLKPWIAD
jgi:hypothetical protein